MLEEAAISWPGLCWFHPQAFDWMEAAVGRSITQSTPTYISR